jgi:hypothetical protein
MKTKSKVFGPKPEVIAAFGAFDQQATLVFRLQPGDSGK